LQYTAQELAEALLARLDSDIERSALLFARRRLSLNSITQQQPRRE
jgi:hypothetical protein